MGRENNNMWEHLKHTEDKFDKVLDVYKQAVEKEKPVQLKARLINLLLKLNRHRRMYIEAILKKRQS